MEVSCSASDGNSAVRVDRVGGAQPLASPEAGHCSRGCLRSLVLGEGPELTVHQAPREVAGVRGPTYFPSLGLSCTVPGSTRKRVNSRTR